MQHKWILDVIADLRAYAQAENLPLLAEHLEDARFVALAEIESGQSRAAVHGGFQRTERNIEDAGNHRSA